MRFVRRVPGGIGCAAGILVSVVSIVRAEASPKSETPPPFNSNPLPGLLEVVFGLGIVLILAYLTLRFLGKRVQVRQRGSIELIAARQIAPNKSVQVIGLQGRRFLIGVGDQVTLLADLTDDFDPEEENGESAPSASFGDMLSRALQSARDRYRADARKEDNP